MLSSGLLLSNNTHKQQSFGTFTETLRNTVRYLVPAEDRVFNYTKENQHDRSYVCLNFWDNKKAGINSHSKKGVTQKNAHKQRALTKYKKIQDILDQIKLKNS